MSCRIAETGKLLRVCYTDLDVFYRFGPPDTPPELELVDPVEGIDYIPWNGVGRSIAETIWFDNGGYSYEVYAGFERMFGDEEYEDIPHRSFGGVRVVRGDVQVTELTCARDTVDFGWGEGLYTAKTDLGFVWDYGERLWVQTTD